MDNVGSWPMRDPTYPTPLAASSARKVKAGRSKKLKADKGGPAPKERLEGIRDAGLATREEAAHHAASPSSEPPGTSEAAKRARKTKKVNTSAKGTAIELAALKLLEAEGYKVHRCVRTGVKRGPFYFSQSNDVFGCIDLVAKKKGERTRWIQVTAHSGIGKKKGDLAEVPWDPLYDSVEIWRWVGGGARKHKATGEWLDRQYFQLYHLDDHYQLHKQRRVLAEPGTGTQAQDPDNRSLWEVSA